jgi:hypothetical protein
MYALLPGCRSAGETAVVPPSRPREATSIARIDTSLASAARFLIARQSPDGAWRSQVYGPLRDGPSLTPHILSALFDISRKGSEARAAFGSGVQYLARFSGERGAIDPERTALGMPVYTSSLASRVVILEGANAQSQRAAAAWLAYLLARQLDEDLGWQRRDPHYGGWGYTVSLPRKPAAPDPLGAPVESNLSATTYALDALAGASVTFRSLAVSRAGVFVRRCQNFAEDAREAEPRFDDGGFFFRPGDPAKNKAGVAGKDRRGRERYSSYGAMTADGLRALLLCGLAPDHPRVLAARKWLERHFAADTNPGNFARDREVIRDATYHYYCRSVARTFQRLRLREVETKGGRVKWPEALAEELLRRQRPDGSWVNRYTDTKEDDPLVATPLAAEALVTCRRVMEGA